MAAELFPNLSSGRLAIERLMADECVIVRNPLGERDATLDRNTNRIIPTATSIVYDADSISVITDPTDRVYSTLIGRSFAGHTGTGGKCKVASLRDSQPTTNDELDSSVDSRYYRFGIPVDAPQLAIGDMVYITASPRDPAMVGHVFQIREIVDGTLSLQQRCVAERRVWQGAGDTTPPSAPGSAVPGMSGGTPILSGEAITAGRVVRLNTSGRVMGYDPSDTAQTAFGVAGNAVSGANQTVYVASGGLITYAGWALTPGTRYFAGAGGALTATVPTSGVLQSVGLALSATTLAVEMEEPVEL